MYNFNAKKINLVHLISTGMNIYEGTKHGTILIICCIESVSQVEYFQSKLVLKGCVRYILPSLFFKSKREHLSN